MEIELKKNFIVKNLTSLKVGGEVENLYLPKSQTEFIHLLKTLKSPLVFGNWSNVLISSNGLKGDVLATSNLKEVKINGTKIVVDCGVKGPFLAKKALEAGLSGFEFMIGFPGSVGGNVFMNASAHNQSISDCLVSACVFDLERREILELSKKELEFDYRTSILQKKAYILLSVEFELKKASKEKIQELIDRNLEFRKSHQPSLSLPNAGSVFKNPPNDSAGRLLDKAGVKDFKVGGACVWQGHANFIVNEYNATSEDVLDLIFMMYNQVKQMYTIELAPEIKFFGQKTKKETQICNVLYKQK